MSKRHAEPKTFEEKVSANLHEAKSQIEAIEASTTGELAQAEADAIKSLKKQRREIKKKVQDLRTSSEGKATQLKAEIETDMAKFRSSLEQFGTKVKTQAASN